MYYNKEEIRLMLDHLTEEEVGKVYNYVNQLKNRRPSGSSSQVRENSPDSSGSA
ncbi:hypothetical protein [Alkalicoccus urumqiensis]|uniref:hypothetical protein n=1 Tax=Alkalicoccus urumqiensis TaxID=1548213 RepID=UPI0015E5D7B9|nr:hypothetical protein [Alkalicoccus urumqiensis]